MGCIMETLMHDVDKNYMQAQKIYEVKRKSIEEKIKNEYNITGEDFINKIKSQFRETMTSTTYINEKGQEKSVAYDTALKNLYAAITGRVSEMINGDSTEINEAKARIQSLQEEAQSAGRREKKQIEQSIDAIITDLIKKINLQELYTRYLPQFMSEGNAGLTTTRLYNYAKSIFMNKFSIALASGQIAKVLRKTPSILKGYIREDALTDAIKKVIQELQLIGMDAKTIGTEQSKVDVLISLTGQATKAISGDNPLKPLITQLDNLSKGQIEVEGQSALNTDEFLGIQAKSWRLYLPTTYWNVNSLGSRAALFNQFNEEYSPSPNDKTAWHKGVFFLSQNLEEVMGANTVMYALDKSLIWTDDLLQQLITRNKYFAFIMTAKEPPYEATTHVQIADHYG